MCKWAAMGAGKEEQQNDDDDRDVVINVIRWARIHERSKRKKKTDYYLRLLVTAPEAYARVLLKL